MALSLLPPFNAWGEKFAVISLNKVKLGKDTLFYSILQPFYCSECGYVKNIQIFGFLKRKSFKIKNLSGRSA